MEATLQSNFYKSSVAYWGQCPNRQFYYENTVKTHPYVQELKEEILNDLEQAVVPISKQNIQTMNGITIGILPDYLPNLSVSGRDIRSLFAFKAGSIFSHMLPSFHLSRVI